MSYLSFVTVALLSLHYCYCSCWTIARVAELCFLLRSNCSRNCVLTELFQLLLSNYIELLPLNYQLCRTELPKLMLFQQLCRTELRTVPISSNYIWCKNWFQLRNSSIMNPSLPELKRNWLILLCLSVNRSVLKINMFILSNY